MIKEFEIKCLQGNETRIVVTEDFIKNNNLSINKNEALRIMNEKNDIFGFSYEVAIDYITLNEAEKYLNKEALNKYKNGEEQWIQITDVFEATQDFLDYMVFAWQKAMGERGISACRSIIKLSTWMKILSRKDVADILNDKNQGNKYGRPALKKACDILGIKYPEYL